jgi:hypothetical protein
MVDVVPVDVERRGRGRGGAAANGRLVDWTVCSSAWRTWTRSTWSETSGAPDSAAPSTPHVVDVELDRSDRQ